MKKITLLLIPALLALSACNITYSRINSSKEPTSESSEEGPRFATIIEVISYLKRGKYEFNVKREKYISDLKDDGDIFLTKLNYDSKKIEGFNYVENEDEGYYETSFFADDSGKKYYSYIKENGHWLKEVGMIPLVEESVTYLEMCDEIFNDIRHPTALTWNYDENKGLYTAEARDGNDTLTISLQLTKTFFSEFTISVYRDSDTSYDDIAITTNNVGEITVTLPETPVSTIYEDLHYISIYFQGVSSYSLNIHEVTYEEQPITRDVNVKVMDSWSNRELLVEINIAGIASYFKDTWDNNYDHTYYRYVDEDWQVMTAEDYQTNTKKALFAHHLYDYKDQLEFADNVSEVKKCENTEIGFVFVDNSFLNVNFDEYYGNINEMQNGYGNHLDIYTYSNYGDTVIIL